MRAKSSFERNKSVGTNTRAIWKCRRVFKATEALQIGFFSLSREKKRKKRKASRRNEKLLLSGSAFYWVTRSGKCRPGAAPYRQNERFYWCSILFFLLFIRYLAQFLSIYQHVQAQILSSRSVFDFGMHERTQRRTGERNFAEGRWDYSPRPFVLKIGIFHALGLFLK